MPTYKMQAPPIDFDNADYWQWIKYLDMVFKYFIEQNKDTEGVAGIGWSFDVLQKWSKLIEPKAWQRETRAKTVLDFIKTYINPRTEEPLIGWYELVDGPKQFAIWNIKERERWKAQPETHR